MQTRSDSGLETGTVAVYRSISGFWRRLVALLWDGLILGIVGFVSGLFFFDSYAQLGPLGRLIGFGVESIYFGFLNSSIGNITIGSSGG